MTNGQASDDTKPLTLESLEKRQTELEESVDAARSNMKQRSIFTSVVTMTPILLTVILVIVFGIVYKNHCFKTYPTSPSEPITTVQAMNQAFQIERRGAPSLFVNGIPGTEKIILLQNMVSFGLQVAIITTIIVLLMNNQE